MCSLGATLVDGSNDGNGVVSMRDSCSGGGDDADAMMIMIMIANWKGIFFAVKMEMFFFWQ